VAHDSKGFEPASADTFNVVKEFIERRTSKELPLHERLHVVWCVYHTKPTSCSNLSIRLCIKIPTANARVIEAGQEDLLKLVHHLKGMFSQLSLLAALI
jgi:hypothetical protein